MPIFASATPSWLILLMAYVPVAVWMALFVRHDTHREPRRLLMWTFLFGMLSTVPLIAYRFFAGSHPSINLLARFQEATHRDWLAYLGFFLVVAVVEEYLKHVAMLLIVERHRKEFTQVVDGIVYGVAAAMGFAFLENAMYLGEAARDVVALVFVSRALGATFGHAMFSGTFGYFYAKAGFAKGVKKEEKNPILRFHQELGMGMGLHIIRTHIIPRRGIAEKAHTRGQLVAEGFWLAVLLHMAYNLLAVSLMFLPYDLSWLIAPLLLFGGGRLLYQFAVPANQAERKRLANIATFPEWVLPTRRSRMVRRKLGLKQGF